MEGSYMPVDPLSYQQNKEMLISFFLSLFVGAASCLDSIFDNTCPDAQVGLQCKEYCVSAEVTCNNNCENNFDCLLECGLEMANCINGCPCFSFCPNGCDDCESSFCQCNGEPADDPNFQACREELDDEYYKCIATCPPQDLTCIQQCIRDENENLDNCPCMPGCPTGCPCPNYTCPGYNLTHVLVLNTHLPSNVPLVIDGEGGSRQPFFEFSSDTDCWHACSLVHKGQFYIYGGYSNRYQISTVSNCRLERVGSLDFELPYGGCTVDRADNIYLCFGFSEPQLCRTSRNPTTGFAKIPNKSVYVHDHTRAAASSNYLFVVGSYTSKHNHAELYSLKHEVWKPTASYPYSSIISLSIVINIEEDYFMFGGWHGGKTDSNRIVKFSIANEKWTQIGSLNRARQAAGVVQSGKSFLIVGGLGTFPTERCEFDETENINCVMIGPTLTDYHQYAELSLVPADFCID